MTQTTITIKRRGRGRYEWKCHTIIAGRLATQDKSEGMAATYADAMDAAMCYLTQMTPRVEASEVARDAG